MVTLGQLGRNALAITRVILGVIIFCACSSNKTGNLTAPPMPSDREIEKAQDFQSEMIKKFNKPDHENYSIQISRVLGRFFKSSPVVKPTFIVLNRTYPIINAMTRDYRFFFSENLFEHIENDEQLAALVAHLLTHHFAGHSDSDLFSGVMDGVALLPKLAGGGLVVLGSNLEPSYPWDTNPNYSGDTASRLFFYTVGVAFIATGKLISYVFSDLPKMNREKKADKIMVKLLSETGSDPKEAVKFWSKFIPPHDARALMLET